MKTEIQIKIALSFIEQIYRNGYELPDRFDLVEEHLRFLLVDGNPGYSFMSRSAEGFYKKAVGADGSVHVEIVVVHLIYRFAKHLLLDFKDRHLRTGILINVAALLNAKTQRCSQERYDQIVKGPEGYAIVGNLEEHFLKENS